MTPVPPGEESRGRRGRRRRRSRRRGRSGLLPGCLDPVSGAGLSRGPDRRARGLRDAPLPGALLALRPSPLRPAAVRPAGGRRRLRLLPGQPARDPRGRAGRRPHPDGAGAEEERLERVRPRCAPGSAARFATPPGARSPGSAPSSTRRRRCSASRSSFPSRAARTAPT